MQNFQDTFETRKLSFISVFFFFSVCMAVPLINVARLNGKYTVVAFYVINRNCQYKHFFITTHFDY